MTEEYKGQHSELANWWREKTEDDIKKTVPKAIEYGSVDLIDMGRDAASVMGRECSIEELVELGIWWYVRGKMARWTAAIRRGDRVSDDTVFDMGVYAKMVQRVREVGEWPGDFHAEIQGEATPAQIDVSSLDQEPGTEVLSVSEPPDEEELATADVRISAMREIHNFRSRLKKAGFREFNAAGELKHDEHDLVVSTQYENMGDWRVKIWHKRQVTVNEFIPRHRAKQVLQGLELIEWRSTR